MKKIARTWTGLLAIAYKGMAVGVLLLPAACGSDGRGKPASHDGGDAGAARMDGSWQDSTPARDRMGDSDDRGSIDAGAGNSDRPIQSDGGIAAGDGAAAWRDGVGTDSDLAADDGRAGLPDADAMALEDVPARETAALPDTPVVGPDTRSWTDAAGMGPETFLWIDAGDTRASDRPDSSLAAEVEPEVGPGIDAPAADLLPDSPVSVDAAVVSDTPVVNVPDAAPDGVGIDGAGSDGAVPLTCPSSQTTAYLAQVMDHLHERFYVYKDKDSAGNHFAARGRMSSDATGDSVPPMNEGHVTNCEAGAGSCIEARFVASGSNWGGWYFLNGVLTGLDRGPRSNWGSDPNAGIDLRGATKLTFRARGAVGGERVQFLAFGVGRPDQPYPDSAPTKSRPFDTLTTSWQTYQIDLAGLDLSYVLGGFGWVSNASENGGQAITFYLDEISYDKDTRQNPRFLLSYETQPTSSEPFDSVLRNVAFTYDNAVALLHFLSVGENTRAGLIADALIYAQNHDRYFTDGRLRNAYQAGELVLAPGWTPSGVANTVRMPGFSDSSGLWSEDAMQVGTSTGNAAWAALALLATYQRLGGVRYRDAAIKIASWVENNFRVSETWGGYSGGFEGWERDKLGAPQAQTRLAYRSTEHNLDLFVLFSRLATVTGDSVWAARAVHARGFVEAMWNAEAGHFWTGTQVSATGETSINRSVVPLDAQAWTLLAMRDWQTSADRLRAVSFAETRCKVGNGFDFDSDAQGIWLEGTGQMVVVYAALGRTAERQTTMNAIESLRTVSGGLPAVNLATLGAGPDSAPWWTYYRRLHIGATAWAGFAECGMNPFWFE